MKKLKRPPIPKRKSTVAPGLTEMQEAYCQLASVTSYSEAYRTVYNPGRECDMHKSITKLNANPKIAMRIIEIQGQAANEIKVTREWLLKWWFYRMVYNPAEIIAWAVGSCRYCHGEDHKYHWRLHEYLAALDEAEQTKGAVMPDIGGGFDFVATREPHPDCPNCHGKGVGRSDIADTSQLSPMARAAFEGIKETRNGIEIKMADKDKAAENFAKLSGYDVVQVRMMAEDLPDEARMAELASDPMGAAALYKRMLGVTLN